VSVPSEVQGWKAFVLVGVVAALVGLSYLLPLGSGEDERAPSSPTRGCAHAREEPSEGDLRDAERATLCLLNFERRARGLRALRPDPRLRLAALRHSRDMARRGYLEHDSPEGVSHDVRIVRAGFPLRADSVSGENLASGEGAASAPAVIVEGWMGSPGHRRNVLRPEFRLIGIGIVTRSETGEPGGTYTTEFAGRVGG
jgi:uncharacterized protein YkwD